MLHYGIIASGSNIGLVWAKNECKLSNSLLHILVCANLGENSEN
jgi:hypothetical protein